MTSGIFSVKVKFASKSSGLLGIEPVVMDIPDSNGGVGGVWRGKCKPEGTTREEGRVMNLKEGGVKGWRFAYKNNNTRLSWIVREG